MNVVLLIASLAGGVLLLSAGTSSKPRTTADTRHKQITGFPGGWDNWKKALASKEPKDQAYAPGSAYYDHWQFALAEFSKRSKLLPKNAYPVQDAYTKERYTLPSNIGGVPTFGSVDEFGRQPGGLPQNFKANVLTITQTVAPLIPGVGTAAAATIAYAVAIGEGKSQQDAVLAAAKATIPPQYRFAFDMAVGIADGQSVPEAAKNALFSKYPAAKQVYEKGRQLAPTVKRFT